MFFFTGNFRGYTRFESAGLFQSGPGWIHPSRSLPSYELIFIVEGSFRMEVGDMIYELKEDDFLVLPPRTHHAGVEPVDGLTRFFWVHFHSKELNSLSTLSELRTAMLPCDPNRLMAIPQYASLPQMHGLYLMCNHLLHINQIQVSPLYRNNYMNSILHEINYQFLSSLKEDAIPQSKLQPIQDWIRVHACEPISLDQIAKQFEYNKSYLSRKFKEETGRGISEQIVYYRMEQARWLLSNSPMTIQEIAYAVGYNDPKYFMRVFKQTQQNTPSEYRKSFDQRHFNQS